MGEIELSIVGPERLDDVEPVWWSLHEHHMAVEHGRNAAIRGERQTWELRRPDLAYALSTPDGFMVLATAEQRAVGFAVVHLRANHNWRVHGERYAELETLALLPEYRGQRIGSQMMEAAYERLRALGIEELSIVVVEGNEPARRFYERKGFLPWHVTYFGPIPAADSSRGSEGP